MKKVSALTRFRIIVISFLIISFITFYSSDNFAGIFGMLLTSAMAVAYVMSELIMLCDKSED